MDRVRVRNFTRFFNRELMIYSLGGDIPLSYPIAIKRIFYVILFLALWTGLLVFTIGFYLNVYYVMFLVIPPSLIGWYAGRPVWQGRSLFGFLRVNGKFLFQPKGWNDLKSSNNRGRSSYVSRSVFWVSRRRELQKLADIREERSKISRQKRGR